MRTTRVFDLAYGLAVAANTRARIRRRPEGGYRVEAPLPDGISVDEQLRVLAVLETADRFGHLYSDTAQSVWADIDENLEQRK